MGKSFVKIFIIVFLLFWGIGFFGGNIILAQAAGATVDVGPETPAAPKDDIELTYPWSKETTLPGLVSKFYNIALGLVGVAALGAIIYGGILWTVSKTPSGSQEAKDWITGAIWGLLLLLGAYLLFNTIGIIKEGQLTEPGIPALPAPTTPTPTEQGLAAASKWPPDSLPAGTYSDNEARNLLAQNNISVNKSNCATVGQTNCTSLDGLPKSTINNLIDLANDAKLSLKLSGGTEYWLHKTHGPGKPIVDVAYNPSLIKTIDSWSSSGKIKSYQCESGRLKVPCGGSITPDHYHIVF